VQVAKGNPQTCNYTHNIFLTNLQTCDRFETNLHCTDVKNNCPSLLTHPLSADVSTAYIQQRTPLNGYQAVFP